ncbi:MAG: sigma-70 family RNA polymerase sigma factor, partial [Thermoanaerobaculia bacterium]|nr:sigma-70 family RNA polymerase sigma factor [Thermoanaerobaculia bacterium]
MVADPTSPPDEEIVETVLDGDREAYGILIRRYQNRLVSFLNRIVGNVETAHDLTQEVFIKVYDALDRYDPTYKFSTWIFRIAHNRAIDHLRKRRLPTTSMQKTNPRDDTTYQLPLESRDPSPYRDIRNRERGEAIREAIEELPEDYRELISLRHYAELSYDEIATLKEMPLGTVKNKLFRGRQMLKDKLSQY